MFNEFCPHYILQELLLNRSFSKIELARFLRSHSQQITKALNAPPDQIYHFLKPEHLEKLIRLLRHIQQNERLLQDYLERKRLEYLYSLPEEE